jgi:molybdopterin/thiamine biosynthesis adenylyltransferase
MDEDESSLGNVVEVLDLPGDADAKSDCIYRLLPRDRGPQFYAERTDRNIGWITEEEQALLRRSTVAVAGCGGMGGVAAELLLRAGIGEIRITDPELFDASNIHRQIAAGVDTVGTSKVLATARRLRSITDDTTLVVHSRGVVPSTFAHFVGGADLVFDEVEAWAIAARIGLHREARQQGVHVLNGNSIGAGTRLFLFTPESDTIEECLRVTYEEAEAFDRRSKAGSVTAAEKKRMAKAVILGLLPELPEYFPQDSSESTGRNLYHRLVEEGKAMIFASNPYGAASFLVNHALLHLLRHSGLDRDVVRPIPMPGYLYRDDFLGVLKVVRGRWY